MVRCTCHIGIHEGRTDVRTDVLRTDVHDVMAIKPNFVTSMGYHIFLTMVLGALGAPLPLHRDCGTHLPYDLTSCDSLCAFKRKLKTHLFTLAYD